jgi:hypothetical protein
MHIGVWTVRSQTRLAQPCRNLGHSLMDLLLVLEELALLKP